MEQDVIQKVEVSHLLTMLGLIGFCLVFWAGVIWAGTRTWDVLAPHIAQTGE